jgi:hypothetical protein
MNLAASLIDLKIGNYSDTTGKDISEVEKDMHARTTLNPNEAQKYGTKGLATEIKKDLYSGGKLFAIYETGENFHYIPNPTVTASSTQAPVNLYGVPPEATEQK